MNPLFARLRERGWLIRESTSSMPLLPESVQPRYPRLPPALVQFMTGLEECRNNADDVWMLTPAQYRITDDAGFRWNEYELMALDEAADDAAESSAIRAFWDAHLPIMMAVHSDYDYVAVRVADPDFGSVVHGMAPNWDDPSFLAPCFDDFIATFEREAASPAPAYPYSVFLTEGAAADRST